MSGQRNSNEINLNRNDIFMSTVALLLQLSLLDYKTISVLLQEFAGKSRSFNADYGTVAGSMGYTGMEGRRRRGQ